MQELWKDIPNYEGLYQISNRGNVKSLCFGARNIRRSNISKLLKQSPSNLGYFKVQLYKNGKCKVCYVHRLVAESFIPNPENKPQVNHKDGNKANNSVSNLEWATSKENLGHAITSGLRTSTPRLGIKAKPRKINQYDKRGNYVATHYGIAETAQLFNINYKSLQSCLSGHHKSSGGYIWRYADD